MPELPDGLLFVNLVDFDMVYGHRRDIAGFASALTELDVFLSEIGPTLRDGDLLIVTADHGNDPAFRGTDHTREFVPVLVSGAGVRPGAEIGKRATFADLGATIAEALGSPALRSGRSFLAALG